MTMKITAIETVRVGEFSDILWVQVHADEGIVGLGETFFMPQTVEACIHEVVAQKLIGRDPLAIERIGKDLVGYLGFRSTGAEMRGNSAVDIALWDIFGKATRQPVAQLLRARQHSDLQHLCGQSVYAHRRRPACRQLWRRRPQHRLPGLLKTWYRDLVTALPTVRNGMISVERTPGLGHELVPDLDAKFSIMRRISTAGQ